MQGIVFDIRNEIENQLYDILNGIIHPSWYWRMGHGESYYAGVETQFLTAGTVMKGQEFLAHLISGPHYLIFADLKAFPSLDSVRKIKNYKNFMQSSCILSLLVIDSVQVIAIAKDDRLISNITHRSKLLGYTNIKLLSNEELTGLLYSVWEE